MVASIDAIFNASRLYRPAVTVPSFPARHWQRGLRTSIITMVEGHQCHRVGRAHRDLLLGHKFTATSPNGRFVEGAAAINEKPLSRIEVVGKNLLYFFGTGNEPVVVHIHFGMSGAFKTHSLPGPEPSPTTRLALSNRSLGVVAHLSAMTVRHGGLQLWQDCYSALGPDPLREDADKERLWAKMVKCKKSIGLVLMDQSMIAGIGNIYRAEILFKAGIHPEQPANTIDRPTFERIWFHSVSLLQRGFETGSILTVDPDEATVLGEPWKRRYACEVCQPLALDGSSITADRRAALAAAVPAQVFRSHCAPDDPGSLVPAKMTVKELRVKLTELQLHLSGTKAQLIARLEAAVKAHDKLTGPDAKPSVNGQLADTEQQLPSAATAVQDAVDLAEQMLTCSLALPASGPAAPGTLSGTDSSELAKLSVAQLRAALQQRKLVASGSKADLLARLAAVLTAEAPGASALDTDPSATVLQLPSPSAPGKLVRTTEMGVSTTAHQQDPTGHIATDATVQQQPSSSAAPPVLGEVAPGTSSLIMTSAKDAALEKIAAGESMAVEHVALGDAETEKLSATIKGRSKRKSTAEGATRRTRRRS